jgi:hypothetical protein
MWSTPDPVTEDHRGRKNPMTHYAPGWDAKAIARIARNRWGGFRQMFEALGWPERGSQMMISAPRRIVETYGSIEAFERHWDEN